MKENDYPGGQGVPPSAPEGDPPGTKRNIFKQALMAINVEPVLFFFCAQLGVVQTMLQAFLSFRVCVEKYHAVEGIDKSLTEEFCNNITSPNNTLFLKAVQSEVAAYTTYYTLCNCLPAVFSTPIICAWSDSTGGRRRPILVALTATLIGHIPFLLCTGLLSINYYWILFGVCIMSFGGGAMVVFASCFSSIADQARQKENARSIRRGQSVAGPGGGPPDGAPPPPDPKTERIMSVRIGIASATFSFGMVIGSLLGGYFRTLQEQSVYLWGFILSAACIFCGILYVLIFMKETHRREELPGVAPRGEHGHRRGTFKTLVMQVVDKLKEAGQTVIKKREGSRQFRLYLCFFLDFLQMCGNLGIGTLILLYLKREPLAWSDTKFSYFMSYVNMVSAIGMSVVPTLLTKIPCLANAASKDTILIMIGVFFSASYMLLFAFVKEDWQVYTIGLMMLFGQLFIPGFRTLFTKAVDKDEAARVMAAVGIVENLTPIIAAIIFNNVYSATFLLWQGFCFALSACMQYPVIIGIGIVHLMMARDIRKNEEANAQSRTEMRPPPPRLESDY